MIAALLAGCDDALVDSGFEGDALYSRNGLLVRPVAGYDRDQLVAPRYALFWSPAGIAGDAQEGVEQPRTSRPLPTTPEPFSLFEAPTTAMLADGGNYGLGRLRAYDDLNGNRTWDEGEPFVGDSHEALLYMPKALKASDSPFGRALPAGVHRVELPVACGPGPSGNDSCDANLGTQCRDDDPCGERGVCMLTQGGRLWGHGICGLPYDPADPCLPADGALFLSLDGSEAFLLQRCGANPNCATEEICDQGIGACISGISHAIVLGGTPLTRLCQAPVLPDAPSAPAVDAGM